MKYTAAFLLMLLIGLFVQAQKVPEYETVRVKVLKIEHIRRQEDNNLWYIHKLTLRDTRGIVYRAWRDCYSVGSNPKPDPNVSCAHTPMPRIAETYDAKITFGGTLIYFGEIAGQGYEIESEEVP